MEVWDFSPKDTKFISKNEKFTLAKVYWRTELPPSQFLVNFREHTTLLYFLLIDTFTVLCRRPQNMNFVF